MRNGVSVCIGVAVLGSGFCATLAGCASGAPQANPQPDDGLERVETALLDELYVAPGVPLANYQRVMLDPIEVNFKDGWRMQHPDLSNQEIEVLQAQLAAKLQEKLVAELARGGYTVAEAPARDVLRIRASIVDLKLTAPEVGIDKTTRAYSNGSMRLSVQGFDAPSGALVARASDYEEDTEKRILERTDRVSAMKLAENIFEQWAQELRSALDVAKVHAGARTLQQ